ncbi:MAG: MFS transporter [Leptolinea sp.]|nr:MFS transporter [Leptolinea sp.]
MLQKSGSGSNISTIFKSPAFVTLWLSEGFSMIGDRLLMVAIISLVYDRTGSAGVVGLLMVFKAVPALLLGTLAGVFVDRWNRKWIMVLSNLVQGVLVFLLPVATDIAYIFTIYLAMSTINQFFVPARSAVIPDMVPAGALLTANSLFAVFIVFAIALGPAAGAWIMENYGLTAAFQIDAATFLVPAAAVSLLSIPGKPWNGREKTSLSSDLKAGLAFSLSHPSVLATLLTITAAFLIVGTMSVSGVVLVTVVLGLESGQFGYLMSGLGAGMLIGALITNCVKQWISGVMAGIIGTVIMAFALILLPTCSSLREASLAAMVIGVGMITVQINGQMLLQIIAPDMRGRLMGISQTLTGSANFFASAAAGLLLEKLTVSSVMWMAAALALTAAAVAGFLHRKTVQ